MRRIILKNFQLPGDIVMLTAAVRDVKRALGGTVHIGVGTPCPHRLGKQSPTSHSLHGFIQHLAQQLGIAFQPTLFKGDIHLSSEEKAWISQVQEITKEPVPFWLVAAGGKFDYTTKWWPQERYQAVVDHFRGDCS